MTANLNQHQPCKKKKFPTRGAADMFITAWNANGQQETLRPMRSYPCPHCSQWHITSSTQRSSGGQRARDLAHIEAMKRRNQREEARRAERRAEKRKKKGRK
ncbi:hypothetical protein [Citricoccus nitrophenolicus]|uniref:hypothetical protein n=1 Tax=Citricoccus nitrophenolicus TaxID=863575 RepID=UPI0031E6A8B6